jgi:hypothetical protein
LESIRQELYDYYDLTQNQRSARLKSGVQPQVYQEVHRARHKLVADRLMTRSRWEITDEGLAYLRSFVHQLLSDANKVPSRRFSKLCSIRFETTELFVHVLQQLSAGQLRRAAQESKTNREFFLACLSEMPTKLIGPTFFAKQRAVADLVKSELNFRYASYFDNLAHSRNPLPLVLAYG